MLIRYTLTADEMVEMLVIIAQRVLFRSFSRQKGIGVKFDNSLIANIRCDCCLWENPNPGFLEKPEIMPLSIGECQADHLIIGFVDDNLCF